MILLGNAGGPLFQASGGVARPFLPLDAARGEKAQAWPQFLPDGRHFLYTSIAADGKGGVYAGSLDSPTVRRVPDSPVNVNWVEPGFLLFARGRSLMAQPFEAATLRLGGAPFLVADQVTSLKGEDDLCLFAERHAGLLAGAGRRAEPSALLA